MPSCVWWPGVPGAPRMGSEMRALVLLAREGLRDAARRRVVPAVVGLCLLTMALVNSCTQCSPRVETSDGGVAVFEVFAWGGMAAISILATWCVILAGLVAADHLSSTLEDGSALLVLSRPISRRTFAFARLLGALAVSVGAAVFVLGSTAMLLAWRGGLPLAPALLAILATIASCMVVGSLAMVSSLYLPRIVTFLAVIGGVATIALANLMSASGVPLGEISRLLDEMGPPILDSVIFSLRPWSGEAYDGASMLNMLARFAVWGGGSLATLFFLFDHRELTHHESR